VLREVHEGAILFCTRTEVYFALNSTGVKIWRMLPPTCAREEEIVSKLSEAFPEVNLGTISGDVRRLLDELLENGLVELSRAA
jgi:hypothetical protein